MNAFDEDDYGIPGPAASEIPPLYPLPWFGWSKPNEAVCASKVQVAWVNLRHWPKRWILWPLARLLICSWKGHSIGDTGHFLGSSKMDVWCSRCQKFDQIEISESHLST